MSPVEVRYCLVCREAWEPEAKQCASCGWAPPSLDPVVPDETALSTVIEWAGSRSSWFLAMGAGFVLFAYAISAGIGAFLHQSFPEAGRVRDPQPDNQLAIRFSVVFFAVAILFSLCQLWLRKEKAIWALIGSVCGVSMVVLIFYS